MRLDKFLSVTAAATRTETAKAVRAGRVQVNGVPARRADMAVDPEKDVVLFDGAPVSYRAHHYILLNKPAGVVSATEDGRERTALDLLPEKYTVMGLFPCGRLDKNTEGLLLLTDHGELAHRLLSPRRHVEKEYRFTVKAPLSAADAAQFSAGVTLEDGYVTKPAGLSLDEGGKSGCITLTEGKYHQIKRMMEALGNKITALERVRFGPLTLPADLPRGAWRELTADEEQALLAAAQLL